jgi:hypothetical protein
LAVKNAAEKTENGAFHSKADSRTPLDDAIVNSTENLGSE